MKTTRAVGLLRKLWKWSWVVTFPLACLVVLWGIRTANRYSDFGVRFGTVGKFASLHNIGEMELRHMLRQAELAVKPRHNAKVGGLRRVDLFLQEGDEAQLNEDLPASGFNYKKGGLSYPDGSIQEVSLRYRGDFNWHWAMYKKSIRVKTKKKHMWEGMRKFNLINPKGEQKIGDYLGYWLSSEMGLLTPRSELVELYMNGKYRGMYMMVEQLEELLLRRSGRMPGDIFAGELVGKDAYQGIRDHMFRHPGLWEKVAVNNHFPDESRDSLERLCELVMGPSSEEQAAELRELIDLKAFARFAAFRILVQTRHFTDTHNWRLYYDPWKNRFEPINWDPVAWQPGWAPRVGQQGMSDIIFSALDRALARDYQYLHAQHEAIAEYFQSGLHERFMVKVDQTIKSMQASIASDPSLVNAFSYFTPEQTMAKVKALRASIIRVTDQTYQAYLGIAGELAYKMSPVVPGEDKIVVEVGVSSRRPVDRLGIDFLQQPTAPISVAIAYTRDGERIEVDVTGASHLDGARLVVERPLLPSFAYFVDPALARQKGGSLRVGPGVYEVILRGVTPDGNGVASVRGGCLNGDWLRSRLHQGAFPPGGHSGTFGIVVPKPSLEPRIVQGVIDVAGVQTLDESTVIQPGTIFRMAPAASVIFNGRVMAHGTKAQPIRVVPMEKGQAPWGVFAIRGDAAAGSTLTHCVFEGGSGLKEPLAEYSAMLSIHAVPDIAVRNCQFRDSQVVDDMVHAVYSDVRFENCTFERSLFDALDLDMCTGTVQGCNFIESGNDALDLMTSQIVVSGTVIRDSLDKGVSVGEGTAAMLLNCRIVGCGIGVEIKDKSHAVLANTDLEDNVLAINAYKKNWRYDAGGSAFVYKCLIKGGDITLSADKHSRLFIHDTWLDRASEFKKRIQLSPSVEMGTDPKKQRRVRSPRPFRFPEDSAEGASSFAQYWSYVRPQKRGAWLKR